MKHNIEVSTLELKRLTNGIALAASESLPPEEGKYERLLKKLRQVGKPKVTQGRAPRKTARDKYEEAMFAHLTPCPAVRDRTHPTVARYDAGAEFECAINDYLSRCQRMKNGSTIAVVKPDKPLRGVSDVVALDDYTPPYAPPEGEIGPPSIGYICFACARRLKAEWPEGHCATCHMGTCPECNTRQSLASVDDWDWPKGSKRPRHGAGRD